MPLAAERVKTLFEIYRIDCKLVIDFEEFVKISWKTHAENDVPQPQLFFAFGFSKTNPDCISDSL